MRPIDIAAARKERGSEGLQRFLVKVVGGLMQMGRGQEGREGVETRVLLQ